MATILLKLPPDLQERALAAAATLSVSTHTFVVEVIREALDALEGRAEFVAEARAALAEMQESGLGYETDDIRAYLQQRLTNTHATRPQPKPWRK